MQRIAASILLFIALSATAAQFKFDAQTLTVPDGFEVELIAAPPLIERPISMSFDEQGHLYITDSAGMAGDAPAMAKSTPHRVMRLEDTDGDGKFDKSVVFADKMGFPEGCLWRDGSLYVAAPPQIFKLTDTRGEGVAQKSEIWFDGKTVTHCGNDLHGPYLGRDGWMYWCKGAFAEQTYEREGKPAFVTRAAHIFRARLDGSGIEPVLTGGMDNPVGFTMLPNGERILSCTFLQNPAGGKRDGLIHAIYGGVYGKIHDVINNHKATGGVMPVLDHLGAAAPCGLTCYESKILGDDFQNNLFTCCFNLHKVVLSILVPDGATYTTQDSDFISSDSPDFHPTDVLEDADGSLIVCDTGGWYKICCPTSQLAKPDVLGAVYRVRRKDAPKIDDPRGLKIHWGKLQAAELAAHLDDPRLFVRRRAMAELSSHKADESAAALSKLLQTSQSAESRRGVVWTLSRIDAPSAREAVRAAFNSADASIVHAAIHAASVWRDKDAVERMMEIVTRGARGVETGRRDAGGTDEALPRAAAEALGHIGDKRAVPALFTAAGNLPETKVDATGAPENPSARILEHSIIYALIEIGDAETVRGRLKAASNRHIVRAAMVALDQMDGGDLKAADVIPWLDATDAPMKQTAAGIVGRHPEWGGELAGYYRERLSKGDLTSAEREGMIAGLAAHARTPAVQDLLASIADSGQADYARISALRAMAASGLSDAPAAWLKALSQIIPASDGAVRAEAVNAARALRMPKGGFAPLGIALVDLGRKAALSDELRLNALAAAGKLKSIDAALFDFLAANVSLAKAPTLRASSAHVLASAELSAEQQSALAEALKNVGPLELPQLLSAFERNASEALGLKLIDALKKSKGLRGANVGMLKPLFAKYPKAVQDAAQELFTQLNADTAEQAAHLDELLKKLPQGEIRRGQAVFLSGKAACNACHAIGYLGGTLGPDLTNIGKARNERDLLEAVVYPSASFVRSYEPFVVATKSGERFNGILKKDAPDEIVLATGAQKEEHIPRADVAQIQPSTISVMPAGLEQVLTPQELADLMAFLKNLK